MERAHVATIHGLVDKTADCCSCSEPAVFEIDTRTSFDQHITLPACLAHTKGSRLAIPDSPYGRGECQ